MSWTDIGSEEADIGFMRVQKVWIHYESVQQVDTASAVTCERYIGNLEMPQKLWHHFYTC
jgi:hypothetical protein